MNNKIINCIMFIGGAAIGSVVTWKLLKTRYEQLVREEIESVKEAFATREKDNDISKPEVAEEPKVVSDISIVREYATKVADLGYTDYANVGKEPENKEVADELKPYIISPDQFGELFGYDTISLNYYADKVLADDNDEIIDDVDNTVGLESLNHFGDYKEDPDCVYVRNDALKADYEILLDERDYSDINPSANSSVDDE